MGGAMARHYGLKVTIAMLTVMGIAAVNAGTVKYYSLKRSKSITAEEAKTAPHFTRVEDERGNELSRAYFGANGEPIADMFGIHRYESVRDAIGRPLSLAYYAPDGAPAADRFGVHRTEYEYDTRGNPISDSCFGVDGKPTVDNAGIHKKVTHYNDQGFLESCAYFGVNGEPVLFNGVHRTAYALDKEGRLLSETLFGVRGERAAYADGVSEHRWEYDKNGNLIAETFMGVDKRPPIMREIPCRYASNMGGWLDYTPGYGGRVYKVVYDLNSEGCLKSASLYDLKGKPVADAHGVHKYVFNPERHESERPVAVLGADGKPAVFTKPYYDCEYTDDFLSRRERMIYGDGKPALFSEPHLLNVHEIRVENDPGTGRCSQSYWGQSGEPVLNGDGKHRIEYETSPDGRIRITRFFGVDGNPIPDASGVYEYRSAKDESGMTEKTACFGPDHQPILASNGIHEYTVFNSGGQAYFGVNHEPVADSTGVHRFETVSDTQALLFTTRYFGVKDEPVRCADGYFMHKRKYSDSMAQILWEEWYGPDGALCPGPQGYARAEYKYDIWGREAESVFYDPKGKPAADKHGIHRYEYVYTVGLGPSSTRYYGVNGELIPPEAVPDAGPKSVFSD